MSADQTSKRDETMAREAAAWLIRQDRGLTPAEQDEFLQWLAADRRHFKWLAQHQDSWRRLDTLAEWRPEHSVEPNPDLLARPKRRFPPIMGIGLAAAAAVAALAWFATGRSWVGFSPPSDSALVAAAYESRVLDDGSVVELNRGASITVHFTPAERRVELVQGEAHFKVAKNPLRPFIVRAAGVDVRAVGTAFDVRLGAEAVEVLVTEGHVQVNRPAAAATGAAIDPAPVVAGQRAVVSLTRAPAPPQVTAVSAEEISRSLGWQPRLLDFASTPLSEVVAEFNRHNQTQLVIADPALRSVPIVASFRSDNVDGFVRLLELTVGIRAERSTDTIRLHRAR
jgi:transmembrane sensor